MNEINIKRYSSLREYFEELLANEMITDSRSSELLIELSQMIQEKVLQFNFGNSTSISMDNYQLVCDALDYVFVQGIELVSFDYLNNHSLQTLFYVGLSKIRKDAKLCEKIFASINVRFQNDFYQYLINQEIPSTFSSWNKNNSYINFYRIDIDLSYPLVDGLAYTHDMYNCQGTDLILYYLRRLKIEDTFLSFLHDEIDEFLLLYRETKQISIFSIVVNLSELIMNQLIASYLISKRPRLRLSQSDVDHLRNVLTSYQIESLVVQAMHAILSSFDEDVFQYFLSFKKIWIENFMNFSMNDFDFLVYEKGVYTKNIVTIKRYSDRVGLEKLVEQLHDCVDMDAKIDLLNHSRLETFDLIDLLESDVFYFDEYIAYYKTLDDTSLAILLSLVGMLNQVLEKNSFEEILDLSVEWQQYLYEYLQTLKPNRKNALFDAINTFEIQLI